VLVASWQTSYRGIIADEVLANLSQEQRAQHWMTTLSNPASTEFAYVAEDETGRVVGFASGGPECMGNPRYAGQLYAIYLLADYQRQGIGSRLTLAVVQRLRAQGVTSLQIWVLAENPARGFYEHLGGQLIDSQPLEIGGTTLEVVAYGWADTASLESLLQRAQSE
jgi:GNAT superfamily N-acetyltransferase